MADASSVYRTCNTLLISPDDFYHIAKMSESKLNAHQVSHVDMFNFKILKTYKIPLFLNGNYWLMTEWNQKQHALDFSFCQRHLVN